MSGTGSLACRAAGRLSGSPAELEERHSASAEDRRARLGWLNFRNKREKGIDTVTIEAADTGGKGVLVRDGVESNVHQL